MTAATAATANNRVTASPSTANLRATGMISTKVTKVRATGIPGGRVARVALRVIVD